MKKPTPQFINKLENELRMAYRAQYSAGHERARKPFWGGFLKFFIPTFSGALVIAVVLLNFKGGVVQQNAQQNNDAQTATNIETPASDTRLVTFDAGTQEEQIVQDFDNDELNQIDSGIRLIAEGNF